MNGQMAPTLCALGCGNLSRSIFSGVIDSLKDGTKTPSADASFSVPDRFVACVKRQESANQITKLFGERVTVLCGDNKAGVAMADYVLLGCKPQMVKTILSEPGMREQLENKTLFSVCAGTTIAQIKNLLSPSTKVLRVMPNTPCRIREGMSVICADSSVSSDEIAVVQWIFSQIGRTLLLDEKHFDAATALCGSGPAFVAVLVEAMTDGGVMMGLPRIEAQQLAAQTMQGAARMVLSGQDPHSIRSAVATPGGCTIGGLLIMEDGKIRSTMARTIEATTNIAADLGNK